MNIMTDLEKYELINKCETSEDLKNAILAIAEFGTINGRRKSYDANKMCYAVDKVIHQDYPANFLTRSFGIRQQALYIKYYTKGGV